MKGRTKKRSRKPSGVTKRGTRPAPEGYKQIEFLTTLTRKRKQKRGYGWVYESPREPHKALEVIDYTLTVFAERMALLFPEQDFKVRTHPPYADGSVDGYCSISGFQGFNDKDWQRFFFKLSSFQQWPVSKSGGRFWFSVAIIFNVPDGRQWRKLESRYERYKGAWKTSTNWRTSKNANTALLYAAYNPDADKSVPGLLEQSKYGYTVESVSLRLHWSPTKEKPPRWS